MRIHLPTISNCPTVSVIMAIRNESKYIIESITSILNQQYDNCISIYIAIGTSQDNTKELILELKEKLTTKHNITILSNKTGNTADGLNICIQHSKDPVIVRLDGHSILNDKLYIHKSVLLLNKYNAANVGGQMIPIGRNKIQMSIANVMSSKIGIGKSNIHTGGNEKESETVYLGVFNKEIFKKIGLFDNYFIRGQDWELNYRIQNANYKIIFSPQLKVLYYPRDNIKHFITQYFKSGQWRAIIIYKYKNFSLRYLLPPIAIILLSISIISTFIFNYLFILLFIFYILSIIVVLIYEKKRYLFMTTICTMIMHFSWSYGFLYQQFKLLFYKK